MEERIRQLQKDLVKRMSQLTTEGNPLVAEAYKSYLVDTTNKTMDQIIEAAFAKLTFLVNSIEVYNDLQQYVIAQQTVDPAVESVCMLMRELNGEELLQLSAFNEKKAVINDSAARLAKHGITSHWLICHGLANEQELLKLQQTKELTGITYRKIKGGIRIDSIETGGAIVIPDFINGQPVIKLSPKLFHKRTDITSITLPHYLQEIDTCAFSESGIISLVIPDSVETIGESAFYNCRQLSRIHLPDKLRHLKSYTFSGCTELTNVKIPPSVSSIGDGAFERCKKLRNVQVPDSVARIGYSAFPSRATIYCNDNTRIRRYVAESYKLKRLPFEMYPEEK